MISYQKLSSTISYQHHQYHIIFILKETVKSVSIYQQPLQKFEVALVRSIIIIINIHLSTYLSIHLTIYPSLYLYPSFYVPRYSSIYLSIYNITCLQEYLPHSWNFKETFQIFRYVYNNILYHWLLANNS